MNVISFLMDKYYEARGWKCLKLIGRANSHEIYSITLRLLNSEINVEQVKEEMREVKQDIYNYYGDTVSFFYVE